MSDVKRWDVVDIVDLFQRFKKTPDEFVTTEDYDTLAAEVERLRAEIARIDAVRIESYLASLKTD